MISGQSFKILSKTNGAHMAEKSKTDELLKRLIDGNKRYVESRPIRPNQTAERRSEVAKGQNPFAVIVGCSDSRIPPEIIFDQGIGDLFVVRVAGNIVDDVALGSIEYAADHLHTHLVVVLGHGKCGAVTAAVKGGEAHGHIGSILRAIGPAVEKAKAKPGDLVDSSIRANVELVAGQIKSAEPILGKLVREKTIGVVGAYYDIETGVVDIL
jgi:carbonic anhydrase